MINFSLEFGFKMHISDLVSIGKFQIYNLTNLTILKIFTLKDKTVAGSSRFLTGVEGGALSSVCDKELFSLDLFLDLGKRGVSFSFSRETVHSFNDSDTDIWPEWISLLVLQLFDDRYEFLTHFSVLSPWPVRSTSADFVWFNIFEMWFDDECLLHGNGSLVFLSVVSGGVIDKRSSKTEHFFNDTVQLLLSWIRCSSKVVLFGVLWACCKIPLFFIQETAPLNCSEGLSKSTGEKSLPKATSWRLLSTETFSRMGEEFESSPMSLLVCADFDFVSHCGDEVSEELLLIRILGE